MNKPTLILIGIVALIAAVFIYASAYLVNEADQVIITQFGKPIGEPIQEAGLYFKLPFLQDVNRIERRVLEWDGPARQMATKDKTYIIVDIFARWKIIDARTYFEALKDERSALTRLDDILGSETRNAIAGHDLIEVIRTTKEPLPAPVDTLAEAANEAPESIKIGRAGIEAQIKEVATTKLKAFGIELLDMRIKRVNYNNQVLTDIYERMISERKRIAQLYRSQGQGEAARILGDTEKELKRIQSEAYRKVQEIQGDADAKATEIYATAYNQSPEAVEFYKFVKTMEVYKTIISADTTVVLSTDSDLFEYLKGVDPDDRKSLDLGGAAGLHPDREELPLFLRDK